MINTNTQSTIGYVHSTESFGSVDGPGIRFITFMQGCRLRCEFCHNPDTWATNGGKEYTPQAMFDEAISYREFWGKKGGVTVSGGEPLLQIDFLIEYFKICKAHGVHTCIDSCGGPFTRQEPFFSKFNELLKYTDLILFDLKHIDSEGHLKLTGQPNDNILDLARYLSDIGQPVWIRHVLVPQRTDFDEYLIRLSAFVKTLDNVLKFEVLPYHKLGVYKYEALGIKYRLAGVEPPTVERVENAKRLLDTASYTKHLSE
ncbi:pyruvate formate-lyase-activating protein [Vaginisenegalia massiliensis]|uniref:pyruvate formate-lyase-activating protein n=1 Tax=Vaginisenegalia massiliensis TaxID=2058294 RepID=UPI000F534B51|nr:pyruvate formate-lyase-activating protein [Vaginisenegalia massiliensis]